MFYHYIIYIYIRYIYIAKTIKDSRSQKKNDENLIYKIAKFFLAKPWEIILIFRSRLQTGIDSIQKNYFCCHKISETTLTLQKFPNFFFNLAS